MNALYDPSVTPTGRPGDWISGGSGADKVFGGAGDDVLMGGLGEDRLVGGMGMDVLLGDDDFGTVEGNFWTVMHTNFGDATFRFLCRSFRSALSFTYQDIHRILMFMSSMSSVLWLARKVRREHGFSIDVATYRNFFCRAGHGWHRTSGHCRLGTAG